MNNTPVKEKKEKKNTGRFSHLMDNNKFVFVLSLVIAFAVWVAVAMYKSPEESSTVYNVPITINTENSIVSQRGYEKFWQSDDKVDVTVKGPRYLITGLTADDIIVSANINTVDTAGISELTLKVNLREDSRDIEISSVSNTSVEVYFDAESEKQFDIQMDSNVAADHIADGYSQAKAELMVSKVTLKGPETEINKIKRVVANPQFPQELMFKTDTLPVVLSFEGQTAADTVSANKYVEMVDDEEYFVQISISKNAELTPQVEFTGTKNGDVAVKFNTDFILAKIDTATGFDASALNIITIDYSSLAPGDNNYAVKASDIELPEGVTLNDTTFVYSVTVTYTE